MNIDLLTPLLAADPGTLVSVIILVIAFVSWIMNIVNGANEGPQPQRPRQPGQRPRNAGKDPIQNEIDRFLQEVSGKRQQDVPIEIVTEEERRVPASQRQRVPSRAPAREGRSESERLEQRRSRQPEVRREEARRPQPQTTSDLPRPTEFSPLEQLFENRDQEEGAIQLGEMPDRYSGVERQKRQDSIVQRAAQHSAHAGNIVRMLHSPQEARQAILLREVLSEPRSKRSMK